MAKDDFKLENYDEVSIGDFVRIEGRDNRGLFTYLGEVIRTEVDAIEVLTFEGTIGVPIESDLEIYESKSKPKGWAKFLKEPAKFKQETTGRKQSITKVKTQAQRVQELVQDNPRKRETSLLNLAKKEIGGDESLLLSQIRLSRARLKQP